MPWLTGTWSPSAAMRRLTYAPGEDRLADVSFRGKS